VCVHLSALSSLLVIGIDRQWRWSATATCYRLWLLASSSSAPSSMLLAHILVPTVHCSKNICVISVKFLTLGQGLMRGLSMIPSGFDSQRGFRTKVHRAWLGSPGPNSRIRVGRKRLRCRGRTMDQGCKGVWIMFYVIQSGKHISCRDRAIRLWCKIIHFTFYILWAMSP
jgi:hypothetical protein